MRRLLLLLFFTGYCLAVFAGQFDAIDKYAVSAPASVADNTGSLARYLKKGAKNETEEARAIFAWVASSINYDYVDYEVSIQPNRSSWWILKNRVAVCAGYSALYQEIADSMGLEAVKVNGYGKGNKYVQGAEFPKPNHVWNAVHADGRWILLDATWAHGEGEKADPNPITHTTFNDYWFDTNPTEFAFLHFPMEEKWRFLTQTFSLQQFENLPYLKWQLFKLGFDAAAIMKQCLNGTPPTFPEVFSCKYPIRLIGFPLTATLQPDTAFTVVIESGADMALGISNARKWYHFTRTGNRYTVKLPLAPGTFEIAIRSNPAQSRYTDILRCKVGE